MSAMIAPEGCALPVAAACRVLGLPRATYYRGDEPRTDASTDLRAAIPEVALEWPSYGLPPHHG